MTLSLEARSGENRGTMRYHVRGISRATGRETTLVVNAKHHEAAEAIARREMTVSEVVPEGGLAEPEVFDPRAFDAAPVPKQTVPTVPAVPAKPSRVRQLAIAVVVVALLGVVVVLLLKGRGIIGH